MTRLFSRAGFAVTVALFSLTAIHAQTPDAPKPAIPPTDTKPATPPTDTKPATPPVTIPVVPETPATPAELAEGKARLDKVIKAHGGDAFKNLKSVKLTGKGVLTPLPEMNAPFDRLDIDSVTLLSAAPDKSRLEMIIQYGTIVALNFGDNKGGFQDAIIEKRDLKPTESASADVTAPLRLAALKGFISRAVDLKDKDGKPVVSADNKPLQSFTITDDKGIKQTYSIETDTGLLRRATTQTPFAPAVVLMSDFKETEGVKLPTSYVIRIGATDFYKLTLTTIELNKPVDDKQFAKPAQP